MSERIAGKLLELSDHDLAIVSSDLARVKRDVGRIADAVAEGCPVSQIEDVTAVLAEIDHPVIETVVRQLRAMADRQRKIREAAMEQYGALCGMTVAAAEMLIANRRAKIEEAGYGHRSTEQEAL